MLHQFVYLCSHFALPVRRLPRTKIILVEINIKELFFFSLTTMKIIFLEKYIK